MKTMNQERVEKEENRAVDFLLEASRLYQDTCPELSRFLMQRPREANELTVTSHCKKCQLPQRRCGQHHNGEYSVCRCCSQWLRPGNHRVRLRPKRRAAARVQSVLRREARGRRLGLAQKEMLRRFRTSRSTLMATCHTCNTTSRYSGGANRDYGASPFSRNQSTPGGGGGGGSSAARHRQKTPQTAGARVTSTSTTSSSSSSTPKSLRKDKTPTRTPRASTSSSSSTPASASSSSPSSSSSKVKRWVVQRLSKILVREDEPGRKKSSLKDFLCSL